MMDLELVLFEGANATAVTSNVVEVAPAGLFAVIGGELAGTGSVTVTIQDCDTKAGTFATIATMVVPAAAVNMTVAMGLPTKHKKFVKATVAVASGITGTMTGYISDEYTVEPTAKPQAGAIIPTID